MVIEEFIKELTPKKKKTNAVHSAVVSHIDKEGTIWVNVAGAEKETPTASSSAEVNVGDVVNVEWRNNKLYISGNYSNPSAGVLRVNTVKQMTDQALNDAARANTAASSAEASAVQAQESADVATGAATSAIRGLATVESVVDVINWFAAHKKVSTDTTVNTSKDYYTYNATTGALTKVAPEGPENPSALGWYELSEAVAEYVNTHVATTDDGLSIIGASNGWRVLIASGTSAAFPKPGIYIIDNDGNIVQRNTVDGIMFNQGKPFYIGDDAASIFFDGRGHLFINGTGVKFGGNKTIAQILESLDKADSALQADDLAETAADVNTLKGAINIDPDESSITLSSHDGEGEIYGNIKIDNKGMKIKHKDKILGEFSNKVAFYSQGGAEIFKTFISNNSSERVKEKMDFILSTDGPGSQSGMHKTSVKINKIESLKVYITYQLAISGGARRTYEKIITPPFFHTITHNGTNIGNVQCNASGYHTVFVILTHTTSVGGTIEVECKELEVLAMANSVSKIRAGGHCDESKNRLLLVGNGLSPETPSNAMSLDWQGNMILGGTIDAKTETTYAITTVLTPDSFVDAITGFVFAAFGKIAQIYMRFASKKNLSVQASGRVASTAICTLAEGRRPLIISGGGSAGLISNAVYNISPNGKVTLRAVDGTGAARTISAGSEFTFVATYILA